jgi:hypothetical protein
MADSYFFLFNKILKMDNQNIKVLPLESKPSTVIESARDDGSLGPGVWQCHLWVG